MEKTGNHEPHKKIHKHLKKEIPHGIKKAKKLFHFKYPKLFLLILSIIFAYYIFTIPEIAEAVSGMGEIGYFSSFIAGILFAFGFTAPISVGFFITLHPENILLTAIIAGAGAMLSDLFIFKIIKLSFEKEFQELKKEKIISKIRTFVGNHTPILIKHYFLYVFAGIVH